MIICFARCWCSLWGCFVWLIRAAAKDPNLPASPPPHTHNRRERQNVAIGWMERGGETLQPARCCVYADSDAGINFIMSSATAYLSSRGFGYVSRSDGEERGGGWLAFRSLIFTASLNPWPSMIAFKAVKPQHPSLSFIIYVCGLRGGGGGGETKS